MNYVKYDKALMWFNNKIIKTKILAVIFLLCFSCSIGVCQVISVDVAKQNKIRQSKIKMEEILEYEYLRNDTLGHSLLFPNYRQRIYYDTAGRRNNDEYYVSDEQDTFPNNLQSKRLYLYNNNGALMIKEHQSWGMFSFGRAIQTNYIYDSKDRLIAEISISKDVEPIHNIKSEKFYFYDSLGRLSEEILYKPYDGLDNVSSLGLKMYYHRIAEYDMTNSKRIWTSIDSNKDGYIELLFQPFEKGYIEGPGDFERGGGWQYRKYDSLGMMIEEKERDGSILIFKYFCDEYDNPLETITYKDGIEIKLEKYRYEYY